MEIGTFLTFLGAGASVLQGVAGFQAGRQNAAYSEAEAKQAKLTAAAEASRTRRRVSAAQGSLVASAGAQGTTFEGSPMEVYIHNAIEGEKEAQDKIYEGKLKERSFKYQAKIYRQQGAWSLFGGLAGAAGSLAGSSLFKSTPASTNYGLGTDYDTSV